MYGVRKLGRRTHEASCTLDQSVELIVPFLCASNSTWASEFKIRLLTRGYANATILQKRKIASSRDEQRRGTEPETDLFQLCAYSHLVRGRGLCETFLHPRPGISWHSGVAGLITAHLSSGGHDEEDMVWDAVVSAGNSVNQEGGQSDHYTSLEAEQSARGVATGTKGEAGL
jgi:hypothetical protein